MAAKKQEDENNGCRSQNQKAHKCRQKKKKLKIMVSVLLVAAPKLPINYKLVVYLHWFLHELTVITLSCMAVCVSVFVGGNKIGIGDKIAGSWLAKLAIGEKIAGRLLSKLAITIKHLLDEFIE